MNKAVFYKIDSCIKFFALMFALSIHQRNHEVKQCTFLFNLNFLTGPSELNNMCESDLMLEGLTSGLHGIIRIV